MKCKCLTVNDKKTRRLFLSLPNEIYDKNECPQDYKTEKKILDGTHVLSKDFSIKPFVVIDEYNHPICRCILTYYPDDSVGYVGFFEARDCQRAVDEMMFYVARQAKDDGKTKLIGPFNSSIYIGYRMKIDRFNKTYTGEPYNKESYLRMWRHCGFDVSDIYISNQLRRVENADIDPRMRRVYDRYLSKGYQILSPTRENFNIHMEDVYNLMMLTYTNFVGYKHIKKEQFMELFSYLSTIANCDMIKLIYDSNFNLKAFCVAIPNYGEATLGKITIRKLLQILRIKRAPSEYVILYVGADRSAAGLGCAVVHAIRNELYQNKCTSIGALIHEGNITSRLYEGLYTNQYHYALLQKEL